MKIKPRVIIAIVKKDIRGLLPLILLAFAVFFIQPLIMNLDFEADREFWAMLQSNFYYIGYFLGILLMVSVVQLDPAASLNHDWLTRPLGRAEWLLAKLLFLIITVVIPVILTRFLVNLGTDMGSSLALSYAFGIEKLAGTLAVPLLFAVALLTPNLRKTIFWLTLVFMVFLIPAWSVTQPLLAMIGVDLSGTEFDGLMWVQAMPILLAGIGGSLLVYWILYCRRQRKLATLAFWVSVLIVFFTIFPPVPVFDWDANIALHKALINNDNEELETEIVLEQAMACFPSAWVGEEYSSASEDSLLVQAGWVDVPLATAGAGALTLATAIRAREQLVDWFSPSTTDSDISVKWRIDRILARASISADSLPEKVPLVRSSTAVNRFAPISSIETDYWLVPGDVVDAFSHDPTTRLTLDYDLALLSPSAFELPTDGQRYTFPELGSCKAEIDHNINVINVDCISRGTRPELISAELIGVSGSRVDNSIRASLTADWVEALSRSHTELTISSPDLVDSSSIMLTAYNVERILHRQLVSKGLLGDDIAICPLPATGQYAQIERSSWSDKSPHKVSSIAVERGVRVEVLDWRETSHPDAPTLFLLPGLGATVHSFDELAAKLAERYNVVGMTRRGFGDSSKPDHGYDVGRLSEDVLQVVETLGIEAPILVGHSIGGEELSYLGAKYPERFSGLIYLDAAYDRAQQVDREYRQLNLSLPTIPPPRPSEFTSYETVIDYARRTGQSRMIPEGELMASYDFATGALRHSELYLDAVMMGLQSPDYKNITLPALGIFAVPGSPQYLMEPWYDSNDSAVQHTVNELFQRERRSKDAAIGRFDNEIPNSEVVVLEDAMHWIYVSHEQEVLDAMIKFIEGL